MSLIVMKFGGTSVGTIDRIKNAAGKVAAEVQRGHQIAVVVSAMSGVTDQLLEFCRAVSPRFDTRESDSVVATGEQVTAGLMALALHQRGLPARSWQGWQVRLVTDAAHGAARILDIDAGRLRQSLQEGEIGVVAGFQGVNADGRITTLGRGGSDTSAVALAVALQAERCDIYTDVDGVYSTDPRIVARARKLDRVSYEEMLELAGLGAKVLQVRSVEMAMRYGMPVQVLSSFANEVGSEGPGTLVTREDTQMENNVVTGIACNRNEAQVTLVKVADQPGIAAKVFEPLANAGISVDMIVQSASNEGAATDITFTVSKSDLDKTCALLEGDKATIGFIQMMTSSTVSKISLVGIGMRHHPGVAATMFRTLAEERINIKAIETSEITASVLIDDKYSELAVRALHTAYGLDALERGNHANLMDHRGQSRPGP